MLHVAASVLWVGGVVALALLTDPHRAAARFSPLALGCALLVGLSGAAGVPGALRRLVGAEAALMAGVLELAAALGRTPLG